MRRSFAGNYGPLYQAAYLLGGLQLHALHKELVGSGKLTNRAFPDTSLKENRIPIEMVRAILTKQNSRAISNRVGNFTDRRQRTKNLSEQMPRACLIGIYTTLRAGGTAGD